ncbi:MAG TPA: DUF4212 domain-containing protein [Porticoccaceae bacterium]|nr:DUF4212 domain-containing protein [Porticoccaceae bacterium]
MTAGPPPGTDTVYHHAEAENLPPHGHHDAEVLAEPRARRYWRANLRVLAVLLGVWAFVAVGCGVLFGAWLDQFRIGGFPLGLWFTQQGAMLIFIALIAVYHLWMTRIERAHGVDDDPDGDAEQSRR